MAKRKRKRATPNTPLGFGVGGSRLPINIADLFDTSVVESDRLELKAGWNPDPIIRTICAFANDVQNLGGGYIIVGIAEQDGSPVRPIAGVPQRDLDTISHELLR